MATRVLLVIALLGLSVPLHATSLKDAEVVIQLANTSKPEFFAFSPTARLMASSGFAHHGVRLWDLDSRLMVRELPSKTMESIAFSPDGKLIALIDDDVNVIDVATGALKAKGMSPDHRANLVRFSDDGKRLIFAASDHSSLECAVSDWTIGSRERPRKRYAGPLADLVLLRPGAEQVLILRATGASLVEISTGTETKLTTTAPPPNMLWMYSSDGKYLMQLGNTDRVLRILDGATLAERHKIALPPQPKTPDPVTMHMHALAGGSLAYVAAGEKLMKIDLSSGKQVSSVAWESPQALQVRNPFERNAHDRKHGFTPGVSHDGAVMVEMGQSGAFYIRETQSAMFPGTFGSAYSALDEGSVRFTADGALRVYAKQVEVDGVEQQRVYDLDTGRELPPRRQMKITSQNEEWGIEGRGRNATPSGCFLRNLLKNEVGPQGFAQAEEYNSEGEVFCELSKTLSPRGGYAVVGFPSQYSRISRKPNRTLDLWDLRAHKRLAQVPVPDAWLEVNCQFSDDDSKVACGNGQREEIRQSFVMSLPSGVMKGPFKGYVSKISSKGSWLVTADNWDGGYHVYDTATGAETKWPGATRQPAPWAWDLSPDETRLSFAESSLGGRGIVWTPKTGQIEVLPGSVVGAAFSPDGTIVAMPTRDGEILLNDAIKKQTRFTLKGHVGRVQLHFSPDGSRLLSSGDGVDIVWDVARGEKLVTIATSRDDYVMVTPDNYYMGRGGALTQLALRLGARAYPLGQFDLALNRPDLVLQRLKKVDQATVDLFNKSYLRRLERMGIPADAVGANADLPEIRMTSAIATTAGTLEVPVEAISTNGLLRLQAEVNGVPVFGAKGITLEGAPRNVKNNIHIALSSGPNAVKVWAVDKNAGESLPINLFVVGPKPTKKPDLYVVGVGVSKYQNSQYSLKYAAKDARDLLALLGADASMYSKVHVVPLLDEAVTKEAVIATRESLAKAHIDDVVVLFVAGHGMLDDNARYYFATHDMDFENPAERGLPFDDIEGVIASTPARHRLVLMDTCASGETDEEEVARQENTKRGKPVAVVASRGIKKQKTSVTQSAESNLLISRELFANLRATSGASVIASSSGVEYSFESDKFSNGVFTHVLMDGLRSLGTTRDGDGIIHVSDLRWHVSRGVQELTAGQQHPVARQQNGEDDFSFFIPKREAPRQRVKKKGK
jgi:WD40 repeat protein/uncharacterized caspase-like protein